MKKLQIVSFDVPYPVNYGGVIDVFYKLKAFKELGIDVALHTFEYGRGEQIILEQYCSKVYYYKRKKTISSLFSIRPFIIKTRENNLLLKRLKHNKSPILFEGLHTTSPLLDIDLKLIKTVVRAHNIEHYYYYGLFKSEKNCIRKIFFYTESIKLKKYEKVLNNTNHILSISPSEQKYFQNTYSDKATYIPVFSDLEFSNLKEEKEIVLWHGDLRVSDNVKSALFAIETIRDTKFKLVIASSTPNKCVQAACETLPNVIVDNLKTQNDLDILLATAKVNLLWTYQATGIKLKLLNALIKGRFVVANNLMVVNTGVEKTCNIANTKKEVQRELRYLMGQSFTEKERTERKLLLKSFDPKNNAKKILELLDYYF